MTMLKQRDGGRIDKRESLAGIPALNPDVTLHEPEGKPAFVASKLRRGTGFLERFRPPVMNKRYELDEFGAFVVRHVDGQRSVLEIIHLFHERFGMSRREAELGVVAFVKILMQRGLISVFAKNRS